MSELFTYGSVGGAGGNPGSYPDVSQTTKTGHEHEYERNIDTFVYG